VVQEAEHDGCGRLGAVAEQAGRGPGGEVAEQGGAEQHAGQDLADHLGLPEAGEQLPEHVGAQHQQQQGQGQ
jgi:hypothetical protein